MKFEYICKFEHLLLLHNYLKHVIVFGTRLADAVTSLPQTTTVTLWKTLLSSLEQGTSKSGDFIAKV